MPTTVSDHDANVSETELRVDLGHLFDEAHRIGMPVPKLIDRIIELVLRGIR